MGRGTYRIAIDSKSLAAKKTPTEPRQLAPPLHVDVGRIYRVSLSKSTTPPPLYAVLLLWLFEMYLHSYFTDIEQLDEGYLGETAEITESPLPALSLKLPLRARVVHNPEIAGHLTETNRHRANRFHH